MSIKLLFYLLTLKNNLFSLMFRKSGTSLYSINKNFAFTNREVFDSKISFPKKNNTLNPDELNIKKNFKFKTEMHKGEHFLTETNTEELLTQFNENMYKLNLLNQLINSNLNELIKLSLIKNYINNSNHFLINLYEGGLMKDWDFKI
jgi:hypothetical protein